MLVKKKKKKDLWNRSGKYFQLTKGERLPLPRNSATQGPLLRAAGVALPRCEDE